MRPRAWVITDRDSDGVQVFDVVHGRTPAATGLTSMTHVRSIIASRRSADERVWREDSSDGYRTELTRSFPAPTTPTADEQPEEVFDPDRPARSRYLARYGRSRRPGRWV